MVRLTFSTKTTPFLLVISKAHVFLATFGVVVWASGPIVDSTTTHLMGALKTLALLSFSTLSKALQKIGSDPAHLRGDWIHNCQQG